MKTLVFFISCLLLFLAPVVSKADAYQVLDFSSQPESRDTFITNQVLKEKNAATALALCIFLGPLGVHRIYLGTSKTTAVAYILTGAGFGILWLADTALIFRSLFKKDIKELSNNRHYFLWNR